MAQLRKHNPIIYLKLNSLWKKEIGVNNLFKLKYTLTHLLVYLEDFLTQCENQLQKLSDEESVSCTHKKEYIEEMSLALDNFVRLAADKDVNSAINSKQGKFKYQYNEEIDEAQDEHTQKLENNNNRHHDHKLQLTPRPNLAGFTHD